MFSWCSCVPALLHQPDFPLHPSSSSSCPLPSVFPSLYCSFPAHYPSPVFLHLHLHNPRQSGLYVRAAFSSVFGRVARVWVQTLCFGVTLKRIAKQFLYGYVLRSSGWWFILQPGTCARCSVMYLRSWYFPDIYQKKNAKNLHRLLHETKWDSNKKWEQTEDCCTDCWMRRERCLLCRRLYSALQTAEIWAGIF